MHVNNDTHTFLEVLISMPSESVLAFTCNGRIVNAAVAKGLHLYTLFARKSREFGSFYGFTRSPMHFTQVFRNVADTAFFPCGSQNFCRIIAVVVFTAAWWLTSIGQNLAVFQSAVQPVNLVIAYKQLKFSLDRFIRRRPLLFLPN
uniref:Uncharacterized protein n=1 Tax=Ditylenchus dipsaci TaxID=166011 RepID=A0A915DVA7_9BILA